MINIKFTTLIFICLLSLTGCGSLSSTFSSMSIPVNLPTFRFVEDEHKAEAANTKASEMSNQAQAAPVNVDESEVAEENTAKIYHYKFPHLIIR